MTKQKLRKVGIEDFDIRLLRQAAREGRLYLQPELQPVTQQEEGIRQILQYVQTIDGCASDRFRPFIRRLWQQVLYDGELGNLFFFTRYSLKRGQVNWYRVTVLVCLLREWKVYKHEFTASELHCRLESSKKRSKYYTGMGRYLFDRNQRTVIRTIIKKMIQ